MWFAGIDWADRHHDTVVIDEAGRKVAQLRVGHNPEGLKKRVRFLREMAPLEQIACILETNHGLLITALLEAGLALYPVNPKTIDRKRAASGAKTDLIDAYLLAKHGRADWTDLRRLDPDSPMIAELKALTRDQESLVQSQTRLVNQLTACLRIVLPSGVAAVQQAPAKGYASLFADLSNAPSSSGCDGRAVHHGAQASGAYHCEEGCSKDL